ncbi:hypothetical protein BN1318_70033 [Staphylococcus capitis]|nr:hypothetical protein BN1318_70033 [Staphylococcus capitis]
MAVYSLYVNNLFNIIIMKFVKTKLKNYMRLNLKTHYLL